VPDFQSVRAAAMSLVDDNGVAAPALARLRASANQRLRDVIGAESWKQIAAAGELWRRITDNSPGGS